MEIRDAVLRWARAAGVYARYGGAPCSAVRQIGAAARAASVALDDVEAEYRAGRDSVPSPYDMGWVARILAADWGARLADHQAPVRELGPFDEHPEFRRGWEEARQAAGLILSLVSSD
jgi:hypothetical protein